MTAPSSSPPPDPPDQNGSGTEEREGLLDVAGVHASIMREHAEPVEGREPTPLWLITLIGVLLFWGGLYVQRYSGGYDPLIFDERAGVVGDRAARLDVPIDPLVLGRRVYVNNCQVCHQADGEGIAGQYPPVAQSEWVLAPDPERIIRILLDGMSGPIQVRGRTYNNVMPAWRDLLDDNQIAAVLTFMRQEWGNQTAPVSAEQVRDTREATLARRGRMWTEAELLAIPIDRQN